MEYTSFGAKLRELRRISGISQTELGKRVGLSQDTVSLWEQNKSKPDFDSIIKLCDIFSITADELLGRDTYPSSKRE